jgi:hypothetical protein
VDDLRAWTAQVETWPVGSHVWGHYAEETATGAAICRTENVSACHGGFDTLVAGPLCSVAAMALGVDVVAFKDKLNYKQPGGAGFSPHQDVLAYPGAVDIMSVLVAIDECTTASGCLWVAGGVEEQLPTDDRGVVRPDVVRSLAWTPVELSPGDALCIGGFTPHFSEANTSSSPRRVLVASYAPVHRGYGRARYYDARRADMEKATAQDRRFRISTLADFEGTEVRDAAPAGATCTHPEPKLPPARRSWFSTGHE